jgi:putative salt-induced outer membrane protein YdiY
MKNVALVLPAVLFVCLCANAEQLTLKNGDRITGTVVKSDGKTLVIKTDYAGDLTIGWASIQDLSSDKKLFVATPDKKMVSGTVATQDADLVVTTGQGAVHVPKASVGVIRSEAEEAAYQASLHPSLSHNWAGGLNIGFALARGNSQTKNLNLGFNAVRPTNHDKISMYATSIYSTNDKSTASPHVTANTIFGGIRYDRNLVPRVFVFGSGDFITDDLQSLNLRSILTGGLGFHAIKTEQTTLDLLAGANYTRESYADIFDITHTLVTPAFTRSFAGLSLGDELNHKIGKASLFTQRFYYYPNLNNGGGYRTALDAMFSTKFNKWLGWQTGFSDRYTSNPPKPNLKNDVLFTTGLNLTFTH